MSPPVPHASSRVDELFATRGAATPADLGMSAEQVLALARARPEVEPIFLVRFRSAQNTVRVEEVRAYAWPSQQIGLRHLGYRPEQARLLRLEPRQRVPFPERLYASFVQEPKQLEELRKAEKAYQKAVKLAASKPGRMEMALLELQPAFKKLGDGVALEMWIEAAAIFQRFDNTTYASKMLGQLLRTVEKDKQLEVSLLARTVLSAADDGVFNTRLYEFTWELLQKKVSTEAALGFGLRVFRRLMLSGRALPSDFVKDLRKAALVGKVADFEVLFDQNITWAAGLASFWNTAKKTADWRGERTQEHTETQLLRTRLRELWQRASGRAEEGEAWKAAQWERIRGVMPELSPYGRMLLVELLSQSEGNTRQDAERLLEAALAMLVRPPRHADRERVEQTAGAALSKAAALAPEVIWDKAGLLETALRVAAGDLATFLRLYDLLVDLGESLPARAPGSGGASLSLFQTMPGLLGAWIGALVSALAPLKDGRDEDGVRDGEVWLVGPLGEALSMMKPEQAPEHLTELGPLLAKRLAGDLARGRNWINANTDNKQCTYKCKRHWQMKGCWRDMGLP